MWLDNGALWREPKYKPVGLQLELQLKQIPPELPAVFIETRGQPPAKRVALGALDVFVIP